ncbi:hypothetical protein BH10ACI4_BH10ACI4_12140 [soil metagenome]
MNQLITHPAAQTTAPARALHLWHLLSLDAPTVATLWTWFVARAAGLHLPASALAAMFVAVWMLYAADRLLDARQLFSDPLHTDELEARHLFHHRHASAFLATLAACAIVLAFLLHHLLPQALELYTILGVLLFSWFLLIHARAAGNRLPKELAVGIFFPAAVFIPTVARLPQIRLALLPHALLFAAVCTLNCLAIYAWEHPASDTNSSTAAHWTTRYATRRLQTLAATITFAAIAFAAITRTTTLWPLSCAAALSALLLLLLDRQHHRLSPLTFRAAADLALLAPLLLLWALK